MTISAYLSLDSSERKIIDQLESAHEEADTSLFLHAKHASNLATLNAIVIVADDTDVLLIALMVSCNIAVPLFVRSRTHNHTQIINVNQVVSKIA